MDFERIFFKDKSGREIVIRAYEPKDREALVDMYVNYSPEDRSLGLPPVGKKAIEEWMTYIEKNGFSIVAEHEGKIVGHLTIVEEDKNPSIVELAIFLKKAYQNQGIGTQMVKAIIDFAKKKGYKKITLVTDRLNWRAIRVYRKCGFQTVLASYELYMELPLTDKFQSSR
ncbi:MAG: GNAT family N-acetyltransferase [Archaeoglobaceae archaeon]|nr:GNAT family N-acetyltransferase [Archaeoglobaceae archaeon]